MDEIIYHIRSLAPLRDSVPIYHRTGSRIGRKRLFTPGRGVAFTSLTPEAPILKPSDFLEKLAGKLRKSNFQVFPLPVSILFHPIHVPDTYSVIMLASKNNRAFFIKVTDNAHNVGQIEVIPRELAEQYLHKAEFAVGNAFMVEAKHAERHIRNSIVRSLTALEHVASPSHRTLANTGGAFGIVSWNLWRPLSEKRFRQVLKNRRGKFTPGDSEITFETRLGNLVSSISDIGIHRFEYRPKPGVFTPKHEKEIMALAGLLKK